MDRNIVRAPHLVAKNMKTPKSLTKNGIWNIREEIDPETKIFTSKGLIL